LSGTKNKYFIFRR